MEGIFWYSLRSLVRRVRETAPVYCSIGSGTCLVFSVVSLNEMVKHQAEIRLLGLVSDEFYLERAATWLMSLGMLVSFLHTQLLMERLVQDRFVEFGVLINIGIPRATVALLVSGENLGYAVVGSLVGILFGLLLVLLASFSSDFVPPTSKDLVVGSVTATIVPVIAVLPVATTLFLRLLGGSGGITRVR